MLTAHGIRDATSRPRRNSFSHLRLGRTHEAAGRADEYARRGGQGPAIPGPRRALPGAVVTSRVPDGDFETALDRTRKRRTYSRPPARSSFMARTFATSAKACPGTQQLRTAIGI